jgi:lysophospholipase L1-like esterase
MGSRGRRRRKVDRRRAAATTAAPKQPWAVASTLVWFLVFWVAYSDDGMSALADRIARRPDHRAAPPALPGTRAPEVADVDSDVGGDPEPDPTVAQGASATTASRGAAKAARIEDACVDGTPADCKRWAMDGFYRAVADVRAAQAARPVRVSYYGDSVISTDAVPARVRSRLQTELGDGGPGWIWAAKPHRFCHHEGVSIKDTGTWKTWAAPIAPASDGLHGVGGSTAETSSGTAILSSKTAFTDAEVFYLAQPGGGSFDLVVGGAVAATIDTAGETKQARFERVHHDKPGKRVEIRATGKVRLFGLVLENTTGAVVDNMGLVSATVKNLANNRADHWERQLARRASDLVIVMLGANEAEWLPAGKAAMAEYRTHYEAILAPIRAGLPEAACLVVSPLDQAYDADGELASRPVMPLLVAAQRAAAQARGCAFFSAYDWGGGKGSAVTWHRKGLVGDDFQHLSRRGANKLADALVDAVLAGARDFQTR